MRLTKYRKTDGTINLDGFWGALDKLTVKTTLLSLCSSLVKMRSHFYKPTLGWYAVVSWEVCSKKDS